MTKVKNKPVYFTPVVHESVRVSIDAFDNDSIAEYLRRQGYHVAIGDPPVDHDGADGIGAFLLSEDECDRLCTLALCGQQQAARDWLCDRMGEHIGRSLSPGEHGRAA